LKYEKQQAGEIVIQNRFLKWLDNFWYHYKWPVIIIAFFLIVSLICFSQCATKEVGDVTLSYAGNYTMNEEERRRVIEVFEAVAPEKEVDGQRRPSEVVMATFSVYTEEELRPLYFDEQGNGDLYAFESAKQLSKENLSNFGSFVMTGESAIWLVSEFVFEQRNLAEVAVPLSELFAETPVGAYRDCAIRLGDTELYQYYDALKVLPADTLIVMPRGYVWGETSNEARYAEFKEMYYAIVNFRAP